MTVTVASLPKVCPLLPTVENYYSRVLQPIIGELQFALLYHPENISSMEILLRKIPADARLRLLSEFLTYFLQCCRFGDDSTQCIRIQSILTLCPLAASTRDIEGMTSLHYFCMRGKGLCDLPILFKILEINPDLVRIQNNFGESPLHQLVGQNHPDPKVIGILLKACPSAFGQVIPCSSKYPLHIIMANTRINSSASCLEAAKIIMTGYPEAAITEIFEDRLILQVGGPAGGVRMQRKWNPLKRAEEEIPQLFAFMEAHFAELGLRRLFPRNVKKSYNHSERYLRDAEAEHQTSVKVI